MQPTLTDVTAVATPSEHVATPETEERGADVDVGFAAGAGTGTFHTFPGAAAVAPSQTADLGLEETFGATIPPSLDPHPHSHLQPMTSVTPGLGTFPLFDIFPSFDHYYHLPPPRTIFCVGEDFFGSQNCFVVMCLKVNEKPPGSTICIVFF